MLSSVLFWRCVKDDSKTKGERKKKAETETEAPRELGKGLVGELLKREYRKSRMINEVRMNMANLTTYRLVPSDNILIIQSFSLPLLNSNKVNIIKVKNV